MCIGRRRQEGLVPRPPRRGSRVLGLETGTAKYRGFLEHIDDCSMAVYPVNICAGRR